MPNEIPLTPTEKQLMTDIVQFASRKTDTGVYMNHLYSVSLGAPALLVVALGEQALELKQLIMGAAVRPSQLIEVDDGKPGW